MIETKGNKMMLNRYIVTEDEHEEQYLMFDSRAEAMRFRKLVRLHGWKLALAVWSLIREINE